MLKNWAFKHLIIVKLV